MNEVTFADQSWVRCGGTVVKGPCRQLFDQIRQILVQLPQLAKLGLEPFEITARHRSGDSGRDVVGGFDLMQGPESQMEVSGLDLWRQSESIGELVGTGEQRRDAAGGQSGC